MQSDRQEIAQGLRMAAAAVVSAAVTATVVIGAGQAWLSHGRDGSPPVAERASGAGLIRTAG